MSRALVVESDAAFAALVQDRLHGAGFETEVVDDGAQALAAAGQRQLDLVVVDLSLPVVPGIEVIRALRDQPATRAVPILAVSDPLDGTRRVEVLRAGANELIVRPVDFEELVLRAQRLSGQSPVEPVALEGRLDAHPLWEVLQFVEHAGKDGRLLVWDRRGTGRLAVVAGLPTFAEWESLRGEEAMLAMLGLKRGRFRFVAEAEPVDREQAPPALKVRRALLRAAWLDDELEQRRAFLPATGTPLQLTGKRPPDPEGEFAELPIRQMLEHLEAHPAARLYDLVEQQWAAPQKTRLAAAWLREQGAVEVADLALRLEDLPSTTEIAVSEVLETALVELLSAARERGLERSPLPFLLVAEPGAWPRLRALLAAAPPSWRPEALAELAEQLELRRGGTGILSTEAGAVALHVQQLSAAVRERVEAVVPACAAVIVWLSGLEERESVAGVVARLEQAGRAGGVILAPSEETRAAAGSLIEGRGRWRLVEEAPESLFGLLRLLDPRGAAAL